ncbi:MAG TPA: MraY family glycosyltransferase [Acetobacteraceae bacterium]|nr:MraY family glycosyltransferase [Acetobacteraceae bacterium]
MTSDTLVRLCGALALLSAATVAMMTRLGALDRPNARSSHTRPTPKGGGVGVVLAVLAGAALLPATGLPGFWTAPGFAALLLAATGLAVLSQMDDTHNWPFSVKLAGQVTAAAVVMLGGLMVTELRLPGIGAAELGWGAVPFTLLWLVFVTNAVNFIDGLNGLAAGVALIAGLALAALAPEAGAWPVRALGLLLAAGLAGFLPFNFPRARIFMGDVGSQFCGFVLGALAVACGRQEGAGLSFLLVPMLLAGVLFDVAFTLVRRAIAGERLTEAHRGHLYQVAHRSGMPAPAVTLVHWGFTLWGGLCCALFLAAPPPAKPLVPLLVLPPQLAWALLVAHRARRAHLGRW